MAGLMKPLIKRDYDTENGIERITDTYRVVCEPGDDEFTARDYLGILRYSIHPKYLLTRAKSAQVSHPGDEGWIFDIAIRYDNEPFQAGVSGVQDPITLEHTTPNSNPATSDTSVHPELRPWVFAYGHVDVAEPMEADADGKPLRNNVGQMFAPPPVIERPRRVIRVTAWMPITFPALDKADQFIGTVNDTDWGRYDKNEVLCNTYDTTTERIQDSDFWRIDIELHINKRRQVPLLNGDPGFRWVGGWQPLWVQHVGTMQVVGGNVVSILEDDGTGRPIRTPVLLKRSTGTRATVAEIDADPGPDSDCTDLGFPCSTELHKPFNPYFAEDFTELLTP